MSTLRTRLRELTRFGLYFQLAPDDAYLSCMYTLSERLERVQTEANL
jgi:hypothetical protein